MASDFVNFNLLEYLKLNFLCGNNFIAVCTLTFETLKKSLCYSPNS